MTEHNTIMTKTEPTQTPRKAGRPPSENPSRIMMHVRVTDEQYKHYLEIGGARWLKRLLDELIAKGAS